MERPDGEKIDLEALRRACQGMARLLDDPQPGLITWLKAFYDRADAIRFELDGTRPRF